MYSAYKGDKFGESTSSVSSYHTILNLYTPDSVVKWHGYIMIGKQLATILYTIIFLCFNVVTEYNGESSTETSSESSAPVKSNPQPESSGNIIIT